MKMTSMVAVIVILAGVAACERKADRPSETQTTGAGTMGGATDRSGAPGMMGHDAAAMMEMGHDAGSMMMGHDGGAMGGGGRY